MGIDEPDIDSGGFLKGCRDANRPYRRRSGLSGGSRDFYKLEVNFDKETLQSAAGLTVYEPGELMDRQVVAVVNLGTVNIAGFSSEYLVTGVDGWESSISNPSGRSLMKHACIDLGNSEHVHFDRENRLRSARL